MDNITSISLDGKRLPNFQKLKIKEAISSHAECSLEVDIAELQPRGSHTIDEVKDLLGKIMVVTFGKEAAVECLFIIVDIALKHKEGHEGVFRIKGASKSILLNGLPSNKSWLNSSLQNIIKERIDLTNVDAQVQPAYTSNLEYVAKYQETDWNFILRLAKTYGMAVLNTGAELIVGELPNDPPIDLEYGRELSNISLKIKTAPSNYNVYSYNPSDDTQVESNVKNNVTGLNELAVNAFNTSASIYNTPNVSHTNGQTKDKRESENYVANKQATAVADLHVLEADCDVQGLKLGAIINVKSASNDLGEGFEIKYYGEYRIIEIKHKATGLGQYAASLKAIPSGITVLPAPEVSFPIANAQVATVISNEDPMGMGRVKVQMNWQKNTDTTSWVRVLMTDAGSSEHHGQNRGHVFIPEVNDQVMVDFKYANPERPFILGSVFHANNAAGGGVDNNKKSIITKSGHVIQFNDAQNQESITITDKNSNIIFIDTANNNIDITANETISFNCKNMNINVAENMNTIVGTNITESAGQNVITSAGTNINQSAGADFVNKSVNMSDEIDEKMDVSAKVSQDIVGKLDLSSTVENLNFNSATKIASNTKEQSNFQ